MPAADPRSVPRALALLACSLAALLVFGARPAGATPVTITARDRASLAPVTEFRYVINEDNSTTSPSTLNPHSYSPLVAVGDDSDPTVDLPPGRYVLTLLSGPFPESRPGSPADYKMWGRTFTVGASALTLNVDLIANPQPLSTLRVHVFDDSQSVNTEDDIPLEAGVPGFKIVVEDTLGEVVVDANNEPLCGGECVTDADGTAVIPNLPPGKYDVEAIPPDGTNWLQTTTIEGGFHTEAFLPEGFNGFSTEEGFVQAQVWFGFVQPCSFGNAADHCPTNDAAGTGTIKGRIRETVGLTAIGVPRLGPPVTNALVALNNISGDDEQVYAARADADGTFSIANVPAGNYELAYWDEPLDTIMQFNRVQVGAGQTVDLGDISSPRWFGRIRGYAYTDNGIAKDGTSIPGAAGNGLRDCYNAGGGVDPTNAATCERGIAGQDLDVRHKDGTIQYATFADTNGFYEFPEHFEFEHFLIWEVGYARMAQVSVTSYKTDDFGRPLSYPGGFLNKDEGLASLLQSELTWGGLTNWIDTAKRPFAAGENGGIVGIVFYATTRNEFNPRYAVPEDYEPGVPGTTINAYTAELDADGEPIVEPDGSLRRGQLVASVETDSWYDNRPTDCNVPAFLGKPAFLDPSCVELPRLFNQVKSGVFDGGYAFEDDCSATLADPDGDADGDGVANRYDPDLLGADCQPLAPGKYIVEVAPLDGYRVIREEDQNTDQGDSFVPSVPPPPCAGALHEVNDERNPADGTMQPLCDRRLVTVEDGFNQNSDFFVMTENAVPPAGRIRGLLLDDLLVQANQGSVVFAEKRGIPDTPIGILDYAGNEIARTYSDDNGYWEVVVPSTYTALCPIPQGICPGVYQVVGNYPGTPINPDPKWNPNYGTLNLAFDVWPGKTTYADVAILPITGFVQNPNSGFEQPPDCTIPAGTPDVQSVSTAAAAPGSEITIRGTNFGTAKGKVKIGEDLTVSSWSNTEIKATLLIRHKPGAYQLVVTSSAGKDSRVLGLTFHVLGTGYNPPLVRVGPTRTYKTIQAGLDAAAAGSLVLVDAGEYRENVILAKNVKLQGLGPGVTSIDGRFFNFGGITPEQFQAKVAATPYDGPDSVPMGQTVTVLAKNGQFGSAYPTQIDGFKITGGTRVRGRRLADSQGGGVYVHAYARNLIISNNLIQANAGNLGGGITLGRPYTANPDAGNALDNENDAVSIHHNRILNNGGVSLAGGIGIFNGAQNYSLDSNVVCGNYSAEYGGGVSHYGLSKGGKIQNNELLFNYAFDEGGAVMVAGEQPNAPLVPAPLSLGSGDVKLDRNRIQFNFSNDDGGGIRLLQPVDGPVAITNNMIANNGAADTGGGIALDDAISVQIVNNTIAKNFTTATAEDADRSTCNPGPLASCPHGAGLVSEPHSTALMTRPKNPPTKDFSDPVLYNNIFWQNEAFHLSGDVNNPLPSAGFIDLEVVHAVQPRCFGPAYSLLTGAYAGCTLAATNDVGSAPLFQSQVTTDFAAVPFGGDPAFVTILLRSKPADPQGNYHLQLTSPAINRGASTFGGFAAPTKDFDNDSRPQATLFDVGADEVVGAAPPPPTADFTIAVAPASASAAQGGSAVYTVTIGSLNGFSGSVALTASGLPAGASASFNPAAVTGAGTSQLTVTAGAATPVGSYTVNVTGTSGALSHGTSATLQVTAGGPVPTTKVPTGTTVLTGTLSSGTSASLAFDDASYYTVNSNTAFPRVVSWYASFTGVAASPATLTGVYKGRNGTTCTQTLSLYRFSTATWVQVDSRSVGTAEQSIPFTATGTLSGFVGPGGEVRVRVLCSAFSFSSFQSSGNLMTLTYT